MAFSEAQRVKIRHALGYPDVFRDHHTWLESAIDVVGGRADSQALVESILDQIDAVETSIASSLTSVGLKRAEDIEWYPGSAAGSIVDGKCEEGRRLCSQLSIMFGIEIANDRFGRGGFRKHGGSGPGSGVIAGGL